MDDGLHTQHNISHSGHTRGRGTSTRNIRVKRTVYVAKPLTFVKYVTYAGEYAPKRPAYAPQDRTYVAYVRGKHKYAYITKRIGRNM
jgi:hypothetical protein